jgi:hypothetical protein
MGKRTHLISRWLSPRETVLVSPTFKSRTSSNPLSITFGSPLSLGNPRYSWGISVPSTLPLLVTLKEMVYAGGEEVVEEEEDAGEMERDEYEKLV